MEKYIQKTMKIEKNTERHPWINPGKNVEIPYNKRQEYETQHLTHSYKAIAAIAG